MITGAITVLRPPAQTTPASGLVAGPPGKSAYQVWLDAGNVGSIDAYLASLVGPTGIGQKGDPGIQGTKGDQGLKGDTGSTGPQPWQTPPTAWAASTTYTASAPASVVTYAGSCYVCSVSHISGASFDGSKWTQVAAAGTAPSVVPVGQCRLTYSSATALKLLPFQGNQLWVNGAFRTVPSAGASLANTGLTAANLYYVYAYMSGSILALEASTTGHATDATYGHEIKSGDGTRSLVGMLYTSAGSPGTFVDSATQRWVASWFNQRARPLTTGVQSPTYSSSTAGALASMTVSFVSWAGETTSLITDGTASVGSGGYNAYAQIYLDGSAVNAGAGQYIGAANQPAVLVTSHRDSLAEGLHTAVVYGKANGSQVNYSIAMQGEVRQ